METIKLSAQPRETKTKGHLSNLRREGRVPAVVYGLHKEPQPIDVSAKELRKCMGKGKQNKIIELDINGKTENVLIKTVEHHIFKNNVVNHMDFIRVDEKTPVIVNIPIEHTGMAIGVKNEGGQFSVMKRFVKVKCLPGDIPEVFTQDITELSSGTVVYVRDLEFAEGTILTPPKTALYGVTKARIATEDEEVETKEGAEEGAETKDGEAKAEEKPTEEAK